MNAPDDRLESWKEIAAYLKRDVRTAQRWETREGLPVYRDATGGLAGIYASKTEIERWLKSRYQKGRPESTTIPKHSPRWTIAGVAALGLVLAASIGASLLTRMSRPASGRRLRAEASSFLYAGSISRDGRYLAMRNPRTGSLVIRDLTTGGSRAAGGPADWGAGSVDAAVFSPDGRQLVASVHGPGGIGLQLMDVRGSLARMLRPFQEPLLRVRDWSHDGTLILATSVDPPSGNVELVTISASDGSMRTVAHLGGQFPVAAVFSPDARFAVYDLPAVDDAVERDIFIVSSGGGKPAPLETHPADDHVLGWAPDGRLLFASDRTGIAGAWLLPVAGGRASGSPRLARAEIGRVNPLGFTGDGSFHYVLQMGGEDLFVADLDGVTGRPVGSPRPLQSRYSGANSAAVWSPDGRQLAFIWQMPQEWRRRSAALVIQTVADRVEHRLSPHFNFIYPSIHWSADGRSLFAPAVDKGRNVLFEVDVRSGAVTPLVYSGAYLRQVIAEGIPSPDERSILYRINDRIMHRDRHTGVERIIYRGPVIRMALSKDGGRLVLCTPDKVAVIPAAGGNTKVLSSVRAHDAIWTTDGKYVFFARPREDTEGRRVTELWRVASEGGEAENLRLSMGASPHIRLHPEGRLLVFTAGVNMAEAWAENPLQE